MSGYPGYNPGQQFHGGGQFQPPPGPGGGAPHPMQPGSFNHPPAPGNHGMPAPPGQGGGAPPAPGYGFAPPPPGGGAYPSGPAVGAGGMHHQPPPPGAGMTNLNSAMGNMNMNSANVGGQAPAIFKPAPPGPTGMNPGNPPPPANAPVGSQFYPTGPAPPNPNQMDRFSQGQPQPAPHMTGQAVGNFIDDVDFNITIPKSMFRPTTTKLPATAALAAQCKVPTGGVLLPFASAFTEEEEIDVVQPGAAGIIRCKRCRTYINPYVAWLENGRRWRCNICAQLNETPSAYFCHLDERNKRRDQAQRPELNKSVTEWVAPSEYMVRPPQPPAYFFVLDVSVGAVQSGMLASAANAIKKSLDDLPGGQRTMVGFITYDSAVHYYSLKPGSPNPQMMVVGDLKELFVPVPDDLLVYLKDSREAVENFLDNLPTMFEKNTATMSCLGPALKAAFTVMKSVGGKMSVFQSVMPSLGDGALKPRENHRAMGTPEEVKILRPENTWYKDTAVEFSRAQISVDMYLFPQQYIDVSALCELSKVTAGAVKTYVAFNPQKDGSKFESQLHRRLVTNTAFEAVLRIRCTKGMKISNFYGNFFIRGTDLLALPNCTPDSVFSFDLVHDEQSINNKMVTIQSALLYTTSDGERRIRVATQAFPVTSRSSELMASVDAEAVATLLSKQAMDISLRSNLDNARNRLQQSCADMVRASKEGDKRTVSGFSVPSAPGSSDGGEKEIPENMKLLPLYVLSLLKNVAFRGGTDVHPDERIAAHMTLASMFVPNTINFIHPRLFSLHNMIPQAGMPIDDDGDSDEDIATAGRNKILLPQALTLSIERLNSDGIFMLNNGVDTFIWVGRVSDPVTTSALFDMESLDGIDASRLTLKSSGNDIASRVNTLIYALHEDDFGLTSPSPRIHIVQEGNVAMETRFFWNLIEDRAQFNGGTYNYVEFMQFVNRTQNGGPGGPGRMGQPGAPMPPGAQGTPMPNTRGGPMPPGPPGAPMSHMRGGPMPPGPPGAPMSHMRGGPMPPGPPGAPMSHMRGGPPSGNMGIPPGPPMPQGPPGQMGMPPGPPSGNMGGPPMSQGPPGNMGMPPGPPGNMGGPPMQPGPPGNMGMPPGPPRNMGGPPMQPGPPRSFGAPIPPGPPSGTGGIPAPPGSHGSQTFGYPPMAGPPSMGTVPPGPPSSGITKVPPQGFGGPQSHGSFSQPPPARNPNGPPSGPPTY